MHDIYFFNKKYFDKAKKRNYLILFCADYKIELFQIESEKKDGVPSAKITPLQVSSSKPYLLRCKIHPIFRTFYWPVMSLIHHLLFL